MSKPSPTSGRRPATFPKPTSLAGNGDAIPPGSPPPVAKKPISMYLPPSPKTPPRSPLGHCKFAHNTRENTSPVESSPQAAEKNTFGLSLQSAREQINTRHEGELQALLCFRNFVNRRVKADGEYVASLEKLHAQAAREMSGVEARLPVVKVWNGFLEAMELIEKKMCGVSKLMEGTISSIDKLIKEKKALKRAYDISRSQLDDEYNTSCSEVQTKRRNYIQLLQTTEITKRKLENTMKKPNVKPDEIEKLRGKYVKSAEKLHTCHNEYIFALLNANCNTKHYYSSMLPFCLDTLQERMEHFVSLWKEKMEECALFLDISQTYQESFTKLSTSLNNLKPEEEYIDFVNENKSEPGDQEDYIFDASLLQGYCSPKVQPEALSINDLTHSALTNELAALEQKFESFKKEHSDKKQMLEGLKNGSIPVQDTQLPKTVVVSNLQAELKALDYKIEKSKVKVAKLKDDMSKLSGNIPVFDPHGDYGVPHGDHGATVTPEQTVVQNENTGSSGGSKAIKQKLKGIMTWINQRSSHSQSSDVSPTSEAPDKEVDKEVENEDDDSYETFQPTVDNEPWYYSDIDRREAELKCRNTGDYLVRYSSKQNKYILTVNWAGQIKHFIIQRTCSPETQKTMYSLESEQFSSIRDLLDFHVKSKVPVTETSGAILMKPVLKDDKWLISPSEIEMAQYLGKGAFGEVYEGEWRGLRVAVKVCRSKDAVEKERFMKEAEILKHYNHPNVVRLIGFSWVDEPLIVMELMTGGSLLKHLKKHSNDLTPRKLLHFGLDACCGMKYLETKSCIHRDLAARNCLVGENDVLKISDFGMSHDECESYQIQGTKQIPIKWTAPEALNCGRYTLASDVWSFGVLLWEVFSAGSPPYPGMSNIEAKEKIDKGYRMPAPSGCPEGVYEMMMLCWQYEPEHRPNFGDLYEMLKDLENKTLD